MVVGHSVVTRWVELMGLTTKSIKAVKYRGGWDVRWDDTVPGLGLRVYPSGRKAFVVSYRSRGRKRLMALGTFGVFTVDQARDRARKEIVRAHEGDDPLDARRRERLGQTFGDLAAAYVERHAKAHKRSWRDDDRRLRQHILASWRGRRLDSFTRADVGALHREIGAKAPYEANRLLALLRLMFRLAEEWGYLKEGSPSPARGIKRFAESKRKRWVTPDEIPRLAQAIDQEPNTYVRSAIWLYLLTGLRKTELLQARRADVDWDRGVLRLPETKSGEEQSVPLSGPALAIMQALPQLEGNPYLLPGAKSEHHLVNVEKPWRAIRKRAQVEDVRLHDLRRTVGHWLSQAGTDLNLIKDALRHADLSTTLVYARLGQDASRKALDEHGRRVLEAAGRHGPLLVAGGVAKK